MKLISHAPRGALLALVALGLGGLLPACGSSSSTTSTTTTASAAAGTGAGANATRRAALAACLKQHGVTLPARPPGAGATGTGATPRRGFFFGGGGAAANPKFRAAFQACGAKFGFRAGQGFRGGLSRANITKYVTCVRQHGYNLPSPNFSGKGPIFPANIQNNAEFRAASRACQSLLVPPRPGGSGTSTTAGA